MNRFKGINSSGVLFLVIVLATTSFFATCKDPTSNNDPEDDPGVETTIDYSISAIITPGNTSHEYSGSFGLTNTGNTSGTETVSWSAYISVDNSYDAGDTLLEQGTIAALDSGATSNSINFSGTYPFVSGSTDYYFIVKASASDDTNTANNESVSSPVTFTILFYETFENAYDNTWETNSFYDTLSFDLLSGLPGGTPSPNSNYARQQTSTVINPDLWNNSQKTFFSSNIAPSYIRFYLRAGQTDKKGGHFALLGPPSYPTLISVMFRELGFIDSNGGVISTPNFYAADTWYQVEIIDIDYAADTYDVYVDGNLGLDDKAVGSDLTSFGGISLYNTDDGQFFYDDILIY